MILVNRNFGNPALSQAIGDMFKPSSNDDIAIDCVNHTNALATSSSLVSTLNNNFRIGTFVPIQDTSNRLDALVKLKERFLKTQNLFIVTEHFLKVLDKVYTKIWNESFTETAIYTPSNLASIYTGFVTDNSSGDTTRTFKYKNNTKTAPYNFMLFKTFVDRAITAGVLDETDRLDYQDYVLLNSITKTNLSTQVDLDNKLITFTCSEPVDVAPDINAQEGSYLYGKKFIYNPSEVTLNIQLESNNGDIKLSQLSSGEKQLVSTFSKVFLENNDNLIILFDEPELSLSIDWQKKFIYDIFNSENSIFCLAVTHSPYIFQNETMFNITSEMRKYIRESDHIQ